MISLDHKFCDSIQILIDKDIISDCSTHRTKDPPRHCCIKIPYYNSYVFLL